MRQLIIILIITLSYSGYTQTIDTVWTDTTVALQEFNSDGVKDGKFIMYEFEIDSGYLLKTGQYLNNLKEGIWIVYDPAYSPPKIIEIGKYENDLKTEVWNYYYEIDFTNVDPESDAYFSEIEWICRSTNYKNGKRDGTCQYSVGLYEWDGADPFENIRILLEGEYLNDLETGEWKLYDVLDSKRKSRNAVVNFSYKEGSIQEPIEVYIDMIKSIQILPNIQLLDGFDIKEINIDNTHSIGKYLNGKKTGVWHYYSNYGELIETVVFEDGRKKQKEKQIIEKINEIEISFLHPNLIKPTDIIFSNNQEYVVVASLNNSYLIYGLFSTSPAFLISSGKIEFNFDAYDYYTGELSNDGKYLGFVESKHWNTVAYFDLSKNTIQQGKPEDVILDNENGSDYSNNVLDVNEPFEIEYNTDIITIHNTLTNQEIVLNNDIYNISSNGYTNTIRLSPDGKYMGIYEDRSITIWDLIKTEIVWTSPKYTVWLDNPDYFRLLQNNIIIAPRVLDDQKGLHLYWYDFINNKIIYSSKEQPFLSLSYVSQLDNNIVLGLGESDKFKLQSIANVDLSSGTYSKPRFENYKYKVYKNYQKQLDDSLALINPERHALVSNKYQSAFSWWELYNRLFNDDGSIKDVNNPSQFDVSFFNDLNFRQYFFNDDNYGGKQYLIVHAFENKVTFRDESDDFMFFLMPLDIQLKKELLFWNGNKKSKNHRIVKMLWSSKGFPFFYTHDHYYLSNQSLSGIVNFKVDGEIYSFDQFDLKFNRPDIILDRLGYADSTTLKLYNKAYKKRLKKMGFTEEMLKSDFHTPKIEIVDIDIIPSITKSNKVDIEVEIVDSKYRLDRINVWVNNVAIYGISGISLREENTQEFDMDITIPLHLGTNKVEVSVLNQSGAESYKETFDTECTSGSLKNDLYVIAISVSEYEQSDMNLKYAVKDGRDITSLYAKNVNETYENVYIDTLFNNEATLNNVIAIKQKLQKSKVDDQVILYVSGHGLLDDNLDFYFASHDMDFSNPALRGISYETLEDLLDSIPARKKLFMMDACHSGEVDKEELVEDITPDDLLAQNNKDKKNGLKTYSYRGAKATTSSNTSNKLGLQNSFELMQELFTNLNRGSGAMVISAAGGDSYALESQEWNNGVFTYAVINGLKNNKADADSDGEVSVSELRSYVIEQVQELTNGRQKPTSRQENIEFDFRVW